MKDLTSALMIILLLFLFNGCHLDELDKDKISKASFLKPSLVAPLAKGTVTVWDLVNAANSDNNSLISKDPDGLIKIIYRKDKIYSYNVHDFIDFPDSKDFSSSDQMLGDIFPQDVHISRAIDLTELSGKTNGQMDGVAALNGQNTFFPAVSSTNMSSPYTLDEITDFKSVTISSGNLKIELENKLKVPVTIKGDLYDITNNKVVHEFTFTNVAPGTTAVVNKDLAGTNLSNMVEFRMISFQTPGSTNSVLINMNDYFKINFLFTSLSVSKGLIRLLDSQKLAGSSDKLQFDFPEENVKVIGAILKKGTLTIRTINNLPFTGMINITINEIKNMVTNDPVTATVPMDGTPRTITLDNSIINLSADPEYPYNTLPYSYTVTLNKSNGMVNYSSSDAIQLELSLDNMSFQGAAGDFGKRTIDVEPGKFNLGIDLMDKITGEFRLVDPKMTLTVRNSMGVPANLDLNLISQNVQGQSASLHSNDFAVPVPATIYDAAATKQMIFNKDNSSIVDFIALPPTGDINYDGLVTFNPSGVVDMQNPNFLNIDAIFNIDLSVELPMQLKVNQLGFKDTASISGGDLEKVETAELVLIAKNGIPLDIDVQLLYVDTLTHRQFGASAVTRILSAAKVGTNGTITSVESSHSIALTSTDMEKLRKANAIIFSGYISSPDGGNSVASLFADSEIELKVVIKAKVNL